uniref:Ig-like domain-containing protein n=1 Tax=Astyanax mexicanus TaxID=7994 RepID=A0A8B9L8I7_ASTMX
MFSMKLLTVTLLCFSGLSVAVNINQSPLILIKEKGESAEIWCSNNNTDYDRMLWYKQTHQKLQLSQEIKSGYSVSGDAEKEGYLTVSSATAAHSGLYFCAVSIHSAADTLKHILKTQPLLSHTVPSHLRQKT